MARKLLKKEMGKKWWPIGWVNNAFVPPEGRKGVIWAFERGEWRK